MKITLCMVLKDEAKTIEKTINSILSVIDEVIIAVDKTTSDNTKEIVSNFKWPGHIKNIDIYDYEFKNDFSKARNEFIEKCNTDWVLVMDGHEYLSQNSLIYIDELKESKETENVDIFDFTIIEMRVEGVAFRQPRLFRSKIRYDFPIHNLIIQMERRMTMPQVFIHHDQPAERLEKRQSQRKMMNVKGLLTKVKMTKDARSMFYLANTYFEMQAWQDAELWYKKYLKVSNFPAEAYTAKLYLAEIYSRKKQDAKVERVLLSCFEDDVQLNAHILLLGELKFQQKQYIQAVYYFRMATAIKMPQLFLTINTTHYTWYPWLRLAYAYMAMFPTDIEGIRECIQVGKQLAPNIEDFFKIEEELDKQIKSAGLKHKGVVYIVASINSFILPIVEKLNENYLVNLDQIFNPEMAKHADVIFCEWADHNAIAVSNYQGNAKKILRVHAYEVFSPYANKIDFKKFDHIIFVADHIKDYLSNLIGGIDNASVIPNGVDLTKFSIPKNKKVNNKIAYAGYISNKKGAVLLLTVANHFKDYEFHIAGQFQEPDIELLFKEKKPDNMFIYPWQKNLNEFFKDKTYIINTSPREGCPVAILEGMAAGLMPLVYNWVGNIQDFYAWGNFKELKKYLSYVPIEVDNVSTTLIRENIEKNYNQIDQLNSIKSIVDQFIKVDTIEKEKEAQDGEHEVVAL